MNWVSSCRRVECVQLNKYKHFTVGALNVRSIRAVYMKFPNRDTATGRAIDMYLKNRSDMSVKEIHTLFTANRIEARAEMDSLLASGTTLVVDRYSYSGIAYSTAMGADYEWCRQQERVLGRPDAVLYIGGGRVEQVLERGTVGPPERYETVEIQKRVVSVFERLFEPSIWHHIDNSDAFNGDRLNTLLSIAMQTIASISETNATLPLCPLWGVDEYLQGEMDN